MSEEMKEWIFYAYGVYQFCVVDFEGVDRMVNAINEYYMKCEKVTWRVE